MKVLSFLICFFTACVLIGQDRYHVKLVQSLIFDYGLGGPVFLTGDTETANLSSFDAYGNIDQVNETVEGLPFSSKLTIDVRTAGGNQWDAGYATSNKLITVEDDVLLFTFWAKAISEETELFIFLENAITYDKEFYSKLALTPDWKQYFVPVQLSQDYAIDGLTMGFHLAAQVQTFDLAGLTVLQYSDTNPLAQYPSSFSIGGYEGSESDAPWRAEANSRIDNLRKADLQIFVRDKNGNPVEGANVSVEMQKHAFGFGSAFVACRFPGNNCFDQNYIDKIKNLDGDGHGFNVGVTENALKWDAWEENWIGSPEQTVSAIQWLSDEGIKMRGHTLLWPGFGNLPVDISQNESNVDYINERIDGRIESMLNHPDLRSLIDEWDVINEITQVRDLENAYQSDSRYTTGRELYTEVFKKVKTINPDVISYLNDYVVLSGGGSQSSIINRYKSYIQELIDADVEFDGIGFQCHIGSQPNSIYEVKDVFDDFYTSYGKRLKITEYDINPSVDEDVQAAYLSDFLTMIFSHEAVDAFVMWGFWDGNHWKGNAPMFDSSWNLKPSGQAFIDRVFKDWWTEENLLSELNGSVSLRAFKGSHKVTAEKDGSITEVFVDLNSDEVIDIELDIVTATQEYSISDFKLYPNPVVNNFVEVKFPEGIERMTLEILTISGSLIKAIESVGNHQKISLDLPSGAYLAKFISSDKEVVQKLTVK